MIRVFIICLCFNFLFGAIEDNNAIQRQYYSELDLINRYIKDNPWILKYKNYNEYNAAYNEMIDIEEKLESLKKLPHTKEIQNQVNLLEQKYHTIKRQEELLHNYKNEPYKDLITPQNVADMPNITNPFLITAGLSYIKNLKAQVGIINGNLASLEILLDKLHRKIEILEALNDTKELKETKEILLELESTNKILSVYVDIFNKNSNNDIQKVQEEIKREFLKLLYIDPILRIRQGIDKQKIIDAVKDNIKPLETQKNTDSCDVETNENVGETDSLSCVQMSFDDIQIDSSKNNSNCNESNCEESKTDKKPKELNDIEPETLDKRFNADELELETFSILSESL